MQVVIIGWHAVLPTSTILTPIVEVEVEPVSTVEEVAELEPEPEVELELEPEVPLTEAELERLWLKEWFLEKLRADGGFYEGARRVL